MHDKQPNWIMNFNIVCHEGMLPPLSNINNAIESAHHVWIVLIWSTESEPDIWLDVILFFIQQASTLANGAWMHRW